MGEEGSQLRAALPRDPAVGTLGWCRYGSQGQRVAWSFSANAPACSLGFERRLAVRVYQVAYGAQLLAVTRISRRSRITRALASQAATGAVFRVQVVHPGAALTFPPFAP